MARPFVPATIAVGAEPAQMVSLYDRKDGYVNPKTNKPAEKEPKPGFRMMGKVMIGGVAHQVVGFVSPIGQGEKAESAKTSKRRVTVA